MKNKTKEDLLIIVRDIIRYNLHFIQEGLIDIHICTEDALYKVPDELQDSSLYENIENAMAIAEEAIEYINTIHKKLKELEEDIEVI